MFCGELPRPAGGVMCVGERPTLLAAQLATEAVAHGFAQPSAARAVAPVAMLGASPAPSQGAVAPRERSLLTDREIYLRLTGQAAA
jgi:hypothetical protein